MRNPAHMTTSEAADHLGVPVRTLARWAQAGRIEAVDKLPGIRGAYIFDRSEVERVAANRQGATA